MSELRADLVTVSLPRAELQEVINQLQRSIAWSQQIISTIVLQAQAQAAVPPQPAAANGGDDDYAPAPAPPAAAPPARRKSGVQSAV